MNNDSGEKAKRVIKLIMDETDGVLEAPVVVTAKEEVSFDECVKTVKAIYAGSPIAQFILDYYRDFILDHHVD